MYHPNRFSSIHKLRALFKLGIATDVTSVEMVHDQETVNQNELFLFCLIAFIENVKYFKKGSHAYSEVREL